MASRTAWTPGNGAGSTWTTAINSADMASMATGKTVLSSVADIANWTNLDQCIQISFSLLIASSTIAANATIAFILYYLNQDGTTYGDGQLVAGTPSTAVSTIQPCFIWTIPALATTTTMVGNSMGQGPIVISPGSFRLAMQQTSGFSLTAGTQTVKIETVNQDLNH